MKTGGWLCAAPPVKYHFFSFISMTSVDRSLYSSRCQSFGLASYMGRDGVNTERFIGFYITAFVIVAMISGIFLWPLSYSTVISIADMPSIIIFISIMMFSLLGCGLPARDRPHFQFHYHGEEFPVMGEMYEEVMEKGV